MYDKKPASFRSSSFLTVAFESTDLLTVKVFLLYILDSRQLITRLAGIQGIYVGKTVGRGRDDTDNSASLPIKHIYLYPLNRKYRQLLRRNGEKK